MVRFLKTTRAAVAGLSLLVLCACSANMSYNSADSAATDHAEQLLRAVGKDWDIRTFDKEVMPGFYDTVKHKDAVTLFAAFHRKLGALRTIKLAESTERVSTGVNGTATEADFTYNASFAKGAGQIELMTIDRGHGWAIERLNVNSDALIR